MWNRALPAVLLIASVLSGLPAARALADDQEGCLFCHRLGLTARSGQETRFLRVAEHAGSAHAPLYCSDCHPDAKFAPHSARPNPASCVGDCHGGTTSAKESHRMASAGAGVEAHRKVSYPRAPCLLCHRAEDKGGDRSASEFRCHECHGQKDADVSRGIHATVSAGATANRCSACHPPHRGNTGVAVSSCEGAGCHGQVTPRMRRLAGHEKAADSRFSPQKGARAGTFVVIAFLGWFAGGRISRPARGGRTP